MKCFKVIFLSLWVLLSSASLAESLDNVVAIVNNGVITQSELDQQLAIVNQQLSANQTKTPPADILKKQVLQHLINIELQMQAAKKMGLKISDEAVNKAIENIAKKNKMSLNKLKSELGGQGVNFNDYRENIRKEMTISRVQQIQLRKKVKITDQQIDEYLNAHKNDQQQLALYHVKDILIPFPDAPSTQQIMQAKERAKTILNTLKKGADFSETAIAESGAHTALQGGDLGWRRLAELPEVFAQKVIQMQASDMAGPIHTSNGYHIIKVVAIKNQNTHFVEQSHVRHILLKSHVGTDDPSLEKQAKALAARLEKGESFAALAKQYSQDPGSSENGGDLGWVESQELVPSFAKAMQDLPLKRISQPVKTEFGWHIIEVLERRSHDNSKQIQRAQAKQLLFRRKLNSEVQSFLQALRGQAYLKIMS